MLDDRRVIVVDVVGLLALRPNLIHIRPTAHSALAATTLSSRGKRHHDRPQRDPESYQKIADGCRRRTAEILLFSHITASSARHAPPVLSPLFTGVKPLNLKISSSHLSNSRENRGL